MTSIPKTIQALMDLDSLLLENLGISFQSSTDDSVTLRMKILVNMVNSQSFCHGGLLFSLADTASAYLCALKNIAPATTEASISFIAPAKLGETVEAVAEFAHQGSKIIFCSTKVSNSETGEVLCLYRGTQINRGVIL